jgi:hypothetical protein
MPKYTTIIKLTSGTDKDYEFLSQELVRKNFIICRTDNQHNAGLDKQITMAVTGSNMLDVTAKVSASASRTGKKFSYSVRKEKSPEGKL